MTASCAPRPLGFRLAPFCRLAWASREARDHWAPRLKDAAAEFRRWVEDLAAEGQVPAAVVPVERANAPLLMRRLLMAGRAARILGERKAADIVAMGVPAASAGRSLLCVAGGRAAVAEAEAAWAEGDAVRLRRILAPECCADPESAPADWNAPSAAFEGWQLNYALHRLGLAPAPWLPCRADCPATLAAVLRAPPPAAVREILDWPVEWSALHGIVQVLTPVFRLVHDGPATADKHVARSNLAAPFPAFAAVGRSFPFRPPSHRPLADRRSTKEGLAHAEHNPPAIALGKVDAPDALAFRADGGEPAIVRGWARDWPALSRWTPERLAGILGDAPAELDVGDGEPRTVPFAAFLLDVVSGRASPNAYLKDFPFEHFEPDLLRDLLVPASLSSWHEDLEPAERPTLRSFYLGGAGTGSPLHYDLLLTSAWNVVIWGSKEWVLCPPSSDARLFSHATDVFDAGERRRLSRRGLDMRVCRQEPGDLLFVPTGWWHQVRNLEPTLAVTANLVNAANAAAVAAAAQAAESPLLKSVGERLLVAIRRRLAEPPTEAATRPPRRRGAA